MERRTKAPDLYIKNALKQCDLLCGGKSRHAISQGQWPSGVYACWSWKLLLFFPRNRFSIEHGAVKIYLIYLAGIMLELSLNLDGIWQEKLRTLRWCAKDINNVHFSWKLMSVRLAQREEWCLVIFIDSSSFFLPLQFSRAPMYTLWM